MESEFEKNLHRVKPKSITQDEKHMLWSNITESIKAEEYIKAHKVARGGFFNMFNGFKRARLVISGIVAGTLLMGSFATAAFADSSRPGDFLFPLDLAVENIQLRLAADEGEDELRIQFASERLEEVKELLALANIDFEIFQAAATAAASSSAATTTATTTDTTATTATSTDNGADDTATTTATTTTTTTTSTTTDTTTTSNDDEETTQESNSSPSSAAFTQASNAFLVALQYLQNSRAALVADGNDSAVTVMDAFIAELTVLADNHVGDIKKSRIVIDSGPNETSKVKIAIKASIDDVETKFNFQETTSENGGTSSKVALKTGGNTIQLNVVDEEYIEDKNAKKSDHEWEKKIRVCYKGDSTEVSYKDIGSYMKKGAKLGECYNDDDDKKYYVCHNGKTLHVAKASKKAHTAHGDYYGKCSDDNDDDDDDDDKYYICYKGDTKHVDLKDKDKYLEKGASYGKCNGTSISVPSCSLVSDIDGRTIYNFNGTMIRSDLSESESYTDHKEVTLDQGKYKVTLMSYDGYVGRENDSQPNEKWHITLWDKSENNFQKTSDVSDIPDNIREKTVIEVVDEAFMYNGDADELYAEHAVYPDKSSSNSVKVICAAFDKIEDTGDTTAPVLSSITADEGQTSANISWATDENATSKVWYSTSNSAGAESPTDFVSSGSLKTSHLLTINGLTADTTYYYFVESSDAESNKVVSAKKTFKTDAAPDNTAPSFTGIVVNASTTEATVAWTTNESTTGTIFYSLNTPVEVTDSSVESNSLATAHGKDITGLTDNETYYYMIVIEDASGNTSTSTESSFATVEIPEIDETAPVVSSVIKEATTTEATISFDTDEDAISTIWYSTISPVPIGATSMSLGLRTSHSYTLTSLLPETTYYFLIETEDGDGNDSMEAEDSFTTTAVPVPADTTPPVVSGFSATLGSTTADISFGTDEDADTVMYYSDSPSVSTSTALSEVTGSLSTSHSANLSGLATSTTYYYIITATDSESNSSVTDEDSFTTLE